MTQAVLTPSNGHWFSSELATGLAQIYQPHINIAIWERGPDREVINALTELTENHPGVTIKSVIHTDHAQHCRQCQQGSAAGSLARTWPIIRPVI